MHQGFQMSNSPPPIERVQWHEGMLLSPQHLQLESGRVDGLLSWHALAANPRGWGLRNLEIDEGLLVTGLLRVRRIEGVLVDGTAFSFDAEHEATDLQVDLGPWAEEMERGEVDVFLCVGRTRALNQPAQPSRFRPVHSLPVGDEISQALPVDVPMMRLNFSLVVASQPTTAFISMRLMTVTKVNEVVRRGLAEPAWLEMQGSHPIVERTLSLSAQMRSKAAFIARQTAVPSSQLEARLASLEQRDRLSSLTGGLPTLEALVRSPPVQPFALYLALCDQLGALARLRPGAVPLQPPSWSQADPMSCFEEVLSAVEDLVGEISQDWRTQTFRYEEGVFRINLEPQWIGERLVLGLRGRSEAEHVAWVSGAIIGSQTVWTSLSDRRMLGAPRRQIEQAPELSLRPHSGFTLFAVEVTSDFIVAEQQLVVSNANESSASQRPAEIVLFVKG
jgi:type VI secretion system protein ImpJ